MTLSNTSVICFAVTFITVGLIVAKALSTSFHFYIREKIHQIYASVKKNIVFIMALSSISCHFHCRTILSTIYNVTSDIASLINLNYMHITRIFHICNDF